MLAAAFAASPRAVTTLAGTPTTPNFSSSQRLDAARDAYARGLYREAADAARQAEQAAVAARDANAQLAATTQLAAALQALGRYQEAEDAYRRGLAVTTASNADPRTVASIQGGLGVTHACRQQFDRAVGALDEAVTLAEQASDPALRASLLDARGNARTSQVATVRTRTKFADDVEAERKRGDELQQAAFADYDAAATLARESGDAEGEARALANAAVSALRAVRDADALPQDDDEERSAAAKAKRESSADAASRLGRARERVAPLPDSPGKARLLTVVGRAAMDSAAGRPAAGADLVATAAADLVKAADLFRAAGDRRGESYALGFLGALYERRAPGRPDDALALTRRAAFLAQGAGWPQSLYRWEWQRGRLLAAGGKTDDAITSYALSAEALKGIRSDLALGYGNGDGRLSFRDEVGPVYFGLADLLLRRAADPARSPDQRRADLVEARETVELLKSGELEDYFRDPCVNQLQSPQQIDDVGRDTAVVYVVPLPDRVELLVNFSTAAAGGATTAVPGAGLRQFTVRAANDRTLADTVARFRRGLQRRGSYAFRSDARTLHRWLIDPIEPALKEAGVTTLVFVPDGALRTIPMAALSDGERYLIERYAIGVSPGLRLLRPAPIDRGQVRALLAGLSEERFGYPGLPNVAAEISGIGAVFGPAATSLLDATFLRASVTRELYGRPFTVVHLASHGEFRGDASQTFVLAYDRKITLDDLQALIAPAQFKQDRQGQPVELLTLSACRTAAGDDRAALGLAGVAVKAGARSAVASLWFVKDEAAARLTADFYAELVRDPTMSKAEAMRRAQVRLLADPDDVFSHPVNWAPFIVIGNWL